MNLLNRAQFQIQWKCDRNRIFLDFFLDVKDHQETVFSCEASEAMCYRKRAAAVRAHPACSTPHGHGVAVLPGESPLGSYSVINGSDFPIGSVEDYPFRFISHHLHNSSNARSQTVGAAAADQHRSPLPRDGAGQWLRAPTGAAWAGEPWHAGSFGGRRRGGKTTGLPALQGRLFQEGRAGQRSGTSEVLQSPRCRVTGHRSAFPACQGSSRTRCRGVATKTVALCSIAPTRILLPGSTHGSTRTIRRIAELCFKATVGSNCNYGGEKGISATTASPQLQQQPLLQSTWLL